MRATETPCEPSSAASARPAGPQPTMQASTGCVVRLRGSRIEAMVGCSGSSLLAWKKGEGQGNIGTAEEAHLRGHALPLAYLIALSSLSDASNKDCYG